MFGHRLSSIIPFMRTLKNIVNLTPEDQYAIFEKKPIILTLLKLLHICILLTSEQIPMRSLGNKKKTCTSTDHNRLCIFSIC